MRPHVLCRSQILRHTPQLPIFDKHGIDHVQTAIMRPYQNEPGLWIALAQLPGGLSAYSSTPLLTSRRALIRITGASVKGILASCFRSTPDPLTSAVLVSSFSLALLGS